MGRFDNILIVSDIDNTFLAIGGGLVQKNIDALRYFLSEGGKFTFATGRVHESLLNSIPIASEIMSAPGIMANGGYIYDFDSKTAFNCRYMDEEITRQIAEYIYDYNDEFGIRYSSSDCTAYCRLLPEYLGLREHSYRNAPLLSRDKWDFKNCCKIVVRGKSDKLDELRSELEARFGDVVELVKSGDTFLEVEAQGVTKGSAIDGLREYYKKRGINVKVYACGDYENDISMLKEADVAVCPSNATYDVKEIADLVLCSCSDGLISNLIERL